MSREARTNYLLKIMEFQKQDVRELIALIEDLMAAKVTYKQASEIIKKIKAKYRDK